MGEPGARARHAGAFIPFAEETSLIVELGEQVLRQACRQAREWRRQGLGPVPVWVNLSSLQLREPNLPALVSEVLRETGLSAESIGLEITESVLMEDGADNIARLEKLKSIGVKLAIDDFGTGYSSFSYLKRLPVDYLKMDRSFIDGLGRDAADTTIVSAILGLARGMKLEVIAEGVETSSSRSSRNSVARWARDTTSPVRCRLVPSPSACRETFEPT